MSSLISGYNYDIFISYRQKDNKGDRWVSTFVEALKTELEATFKEDVSVYFDENPHDRLQETHNVDKSLEGKLKCLIFIPILSQTYCDPNSYAWQYEFLAFNKLAKEDNFGRDIRLRSGNVASRILPIRIHDLEQEDIKLFEKETGSVLRAMDFVFKTSAGVSRPLKANEDHPHDNLNKTFYSDQLNKVGHAIKEIILGMKTEPAKVVEEKGQLRESFKEVGEEGQKVEKARSTKAGKVKFLSVIAFFSLLLIAAILAYPKIFKKNTLEKLRSSGERISVAVMPFQNMTNDTTKEVLQDWIQDILITALSNSKEIKVMPTESISNLLKSKGITNYASITPSIANSISQKMGANIVVYGNIKQAGSTIRLNAQLIDTKTEEVIKSFQLQGPSGEDLIFNIIDSLSIQVNDFLVISKLKKENLKIQELVFTKSPDAYRYFIYGQSAFTKGDFPSAINIFSQAIAIDSNYTYAALHIAWAYMNQGLYEEGKKWCLKVYAKRDKMSFQQRIYTDFVHAEFFETPNEAIKYLKQLLEIEDQLPHAYYDLGNAYSSLYQYDKAITVFEKSLQLYNEWDSKPWWVANYTQLGYAYHKTRQYKKEEELYKKAEKDFPDSPALIYRQAVLALSEKKPKDANDYIEKYKSICKENSVPEASIMTGVALIYSDANILYKAEEYFRQALALAPENPLWLNNLAYFLIDKDRDLNEGLELVNKQLESSPENFNYLDTKGWGLYKQGNYKEALDMLQKSWDLRMEKAIYYHQAYLHLEVAKKAIASQKNN